MPDLNSPPEDVDVTALFEGSGLALSDGGLTMLPFEFCILFLGRPWVTLTVASPSPEDAMTTVGQFVSRVLNPMLLSMGYPANACASRSGAC